MDRKTLNRLKKIFTAKVYVISLPLVDRSNVFIHGLDHQLLFGKINPLLPPPPLPEGVVIKPISQYILFAQILVYFHFLFVIPIASDPNLIFSLKNRQITVPIIVSLQTRPLQSNRRTELAVSTVGFC